jgi:putative protease
MQDTMKILVPVNNLEHVRDYVKSGATEFYVGFHDIKWESKFGKYADINRLTGYGTSANPFSFEELLELIPVIQEKGGTVFITFNSSIYSQAQLDEMRRYMEALKKVNVDGIIVSCPELVLMAREYGLFCVISTIAGCYNSDIIHYYQDLGAQRIILPRDITLDDMKTIRSMYKQMEFEIFIMRCGCMFSDSNCLGMHRKEKCSFCLSLRDAYNEVVSGDESFAMHSAAEHNNQLFQDEFHQYSCGLCAIFHFISMNITAGKIVGRGDDWKRICAEIENVKRNIDIAKDCKTSEEYLKRMIIPDDRRDRCNMGLSCYYPEVRF